MHQLAGFYDYRDFGHCQLNGKELIELLIDVQCKLHIEQNKRNLCKRFSDCNNTEAATSINSNSYSVFNFFKSLLLYIIPRQFHSPKFNFTPRTLISRHRFCTFKKPNLINWALNCQTKQTLEVALIRNMRLHR